MIDSVEMVVFVVVGCARGIAPIRLGLGIGHSALGLGRVRVTHQNTTSIDVRQITVATPHTQQDCISCSSTSVSCCIIISRTDINNRDHFHAIFEYLPAHRIAVCKHHQKGIVRYQPEGHVNKQHQEYV